MAVADVTQTTAASQPLLLEWSGVNYWWGSGVQANYVSTLNAAANQITGDMDFICYVNLPNPTSYNNLITKDDAASNRQFIFSLNTNLSLQLNFGAGLISYDSTIALPSSVNKWLRVTRSLSTGNVNFYYSNDSITITPQSVTWTQLGTTILGALLNTINGNAIVAIGAQATAGFNCVQGKIYRATICDTIGGDPLVDFNPSEYSAATSQTAWTSSTGEVWTINTGTAATGYKGCVVSKTIVQGDGIDDRISVSGLTTIPLVSVYQAKKYYPDSIGSKIGFIISTLANQSGEYGSAPTSTQYFSNNDYFIPNFQPNILLQMHYAKYKNNAQDFKINNGASPTITNRAFAGMNCVYLFSDNSTYFMNLNINTFICSSIDDNSTQNTALYNIIRSMNNNAF